MSVDERELILIIEDDFEIRDLLVDVVSYLNYRYYRCANGREALDFLAEKKEMPVLVICDVNMPEMNGIDFVKHQLAKNLNLNICMLTADTSQSLIIQSLQLGVADFICKPSNFSELCDKVSRLVEFGKARGNTKEANMLRFINSSKGSS